MRVRCVVRALLRLRRRPVVTELDALREVERRARDLVAAIDFRRTTHRFDAPMATVDALRDALVDARMLRPVSAA